MEMNKIRRAGILGTGSYVPEKILTNADLEQMVDTSDEWIRARTGIRERRIVEPGTTTASLAAAAGKRALEAAGVAAEDIDMVIVATCTPDSIAPSTACVVQDLLGINRAGAFDIAAGCSGFVYAGAVASQLIVGGMCRYVLVIGAEVLTRFVDWTDRNTCVLFGDGAGAAVFGPAATGGVLGADLGSDGSGRDMLGIFGGQFTGASRIGDADLPAHVWMDGKEVFKFAVQAAGESALRALEAAGKDEDAIDLYIPHQANYRIIKAAAKRMGLTSDKVFVNVEKYGNTSGASVGIALDEAVREGRIGHGDTVVLTGFGAGLTWASLVVEWE